jgi:hypothetical protein
MCHPSTGIKKPAYFGYSWTTLFFGYMPALYRGDFETFTVGLIVSPILLFLSFGIGNLILRLLRAPKYNERHARKLIAQGFRFDDEPEIVARAIVSLRLNPEQAKSLILSGQSSECAVDG